MDDDRYDGLDDGDIAMVVWMSRVIRSGVVSDLLIGNDSQCFTTEQYRDKYRNSWLEKSKTISQLSTELAEKHLEGMFDLVSRIGNTNIWRSNNENS